MQQEDIRNNSVERDEEKNKNEYFFKLLTKARNAIPQT
jgi:hypothetical protein